MSTSGTSAIEVDQLTKRFGSLVAVSDLALSVGAGEIVGFLGPNGAGKTTTMRTLLGFLRPSAGACRVLGAALSDEPHLKRRVGYLPGDFRADPAMTGADLFTWFARMRGAGHPGRLGELLARLDLDPHQRFAALSKGNRQKVGLVLAFVHDPDVLILDEPTSGLDPLVQREFLLMTREAAGRGAAVLFSSHVLPEVERVAHQVAIIRGGKLVVSSTVDDLLQRTRRRLELHFGGEVPEAALRSAHGVSAVDIDGRTATITVDGPIGPALKAATTANLLRLGSVGDDLEDLFMSLYDTSGAD